ncbi:MAG: ABC transporter permease [Bacteroidaceae bacterium]|nr:ABC transporter permease [Bacteroidaceae bacterium]
MMLLVWKLLRQHISIAQLAGFFFANLFGMFIVLLGLQFYNDVKPLFSQDDGFLKPEYLIVSKRISGMSVLGAGESCGFSDKEVEDISNQPFCKSVGAFTASQYRVVCSMGVNGVAQFGTDMFFESVPDRFVDTELSKWRFSSEDGIIPIILPRTYLAIYNFGFAQSQSLPKISEGIVGMIDMLVVLRGNGQEQRLKGKVIGFSTRLNTILVPESFIKWSNTKFAPEADLTPNRLIVEVKNPTDDAIVKYINDHNLELEDDKLDAGKATYFLKLVTILVMCIGMLISILSFYILMLSIYLLVQKNTEKLRNLLLIGYSPVRVSLPYQLLTVGMNGVVLILSFTLLYMVRCYYMNMLWVMFPQMQDGSMWPTLCLGIGLFIVVSLINIVAVRNRVMKIWNRKE